MSATKINRVYFRKHDLLSGCGLIGIALRCLKLQRKDQVVDLKPWYVINLTTQLKTLYATGLLKRMHRKMDVDRVLVVILVLIEKRA